ncbi:MAG: GH116 family glycosyl-hydrolase [Vicinamibacteria bacterium]
MSERDTGDAVGRRDFVKSAGLGVSGLAVVRRGATATAALPAEARALLADREWPSLRHYDAAHLARIALPLGGIGTGTVSLGGRGDLRDFEMMNRPAKGFVPRGAAAPFLAVRVKGPRRPAETRVLEGPLPAELLEGSHGSPAPNAGLPRFRDASFASAYPFGRVRLSDPALPVEAHLLAMNPLVPADAEASGLPVALFRVALRNTSKAAIEASVCFSLPNFVGVDGSKRRKDWKGDGEVIGAAANRNAFRLTAAAQGLFLDSAGVDPLDPAWGSIALATLPDAETTHRTAWAESGWSGAILDFWDDFAADGRLEERAGGDKTDTPMASLAVSLAVPAGASREALFLLAWHFPNRYSWTPKAVPPGPEDRVGNHYATRFSDAWDVVEKVLPQRGELQRRTTAFVRAVQDADLPAEVKEAALFNVSTLRTQTAFRTEDGRFFGFEGSSDTAGCCHGSCTHVWNYEQATPFLFGALSRSMREVEFSHATSDEGLMSFRVNLPLGRAQEFARAAADGQAGCVLKMYRDWQLSGDEALLRALWPKVRRAVEFCWIPGGWDADRDGVMEGCQHNTMDVEYYGPNPQMGLWYLGALRAAEEMARHLGEDEFARECRRLFESGRAWIDAHLWNGEYYEHHVVPPKSREDVAPGLLVGMGSAEIARPDYQLGAGCLVDQLVGQFVAHVCGLGPLVAPAHAKGALRAILKYNLRPDLQEHFNNMRAFAAGDESALVMAGYPKERPAKPFPYFGEAMTGFEYVAAVGMIYEGLEAEGLRCIRAVRGRYDGARRSPFDEAECGHHYARAMASWAAILALTGFRWSAVSGTLELAPRAGRQFWSNGTAWGTYALERPAGASTFTLRFRVEEGSLTLAEVRLAGFGTRRLPAPKALAAGQSVDLVVPAGRG